MTDELTTERRERVARAHNDHRWIGIRDPWVTCACGEEFKGTGAHSRHAADSILAAIAAYESTLQAERDALAAALERLREVVVAFIHEAEGGDMFCGGVPALVIEQFHAALPSPASQEAVSDG